jgi:glycosyltransferase involved in cell wall biosynthesis
MPDERIVTFPWGVDINYFRPLSQGFQSSNLRSHLGWGKETFVIISTRNWSPLYGVEDLARAFVCIAQQRIELRLLMLGDGPQAALIRQIFIDGGVLNRVHFPGQVIQPDLPDYYRSADLYISTSHSDGTSISLLEAMACGCPVLVSDIPGNREWVDDSETNPVGWLFPDGDIHALAKTISRCLEQRERLPEMGRAARLLVEQRGDWAKNFPRLLQAYDMALGVL